MNEYGFVEGSIAFPVLMSINIGCVSGRGSCVCGCVGVRVCGYAGVRVCGRTCVASGAEKADPHETTPGQGALGEVGVPT